MNNSGLTIGIPVYNEEVLIERAIRCAAPQCERLIVADNASTDGTESVCQNLLPLFPNMEYIRHPMNIGALGNWISILDKAHTPYTMMLGSHDHIDDGYTQTLLSAIQSDESIVGVFGQLVFEYESSTEDATELNDWQGGMDTRPLNRVWNLLFDRVHAVWTTYGLFKTQAFKQCFTADLPHYGADAIFLSRILALGRIKIVQGTQYHGWMRNLDKTPSDYLERVTAKKSSDRIKKRLRNDFRLAQFEALMNLVQNFGILRKLYLRLQCMTRFGVFQKPGIDPAFFLLYVPAKVLRTFSRITRFAKKQG